MPMPGRTTWWGGRAGGLNILAATIWQLITWFSILRDIFVCQFLGSHRRMKRFCQENALSWQTDAHQICCGYILIQTLNTLFFAFLLKFMSNVDWFLILWWASLATLGKACVCPQGWAESKWEWETSAAKFGWGARWGADKGRGVDY